MFPVSEYPDVLVGLAEPDDGAVYALDAERALIITTDFFTPVVDDPYAYGAIAAANAMSDIYAMGGSVSLALNIAVFPDCLSERVVSDILRGAAEKVREAGGVLTGGHTVDGPEPLFGMSVIGFAPRTRIWTKGGALPGDRLILTKPLGVGIVTTAFKADATSPGDIEEASRWMMALNKRTAEIATGIAMHAATDITGFSLIGHAQEMAQHSRVTLRFYFDSLPFVPGAKRYASQWLFPAGTNNNEAAYAEHARFAPSIEEEMKLLLYTPETSGGLLLALGASDAEHFLRLCAAENLPAWLVGETVPGDGTVEVE